MNNPLADDYSALKKQIQELESKLDRSQKVTSALLSGERDEQLLYKWSAPSRVYVKRDRTWYWGVLFVVLIVCVALLYLQEYFLIATVLSLLFVVYVASLVPPENTEHQITSLGIRSFGELYTWDMLKDFWISYRSGREILNIDTTVTAPTRLILLYSSKDKAKIISLFKEKLKYLDMPRKQGQISRLSEGTYIPLADVESTITTGR